MSGKFLASFSNSGRYYAHFSNDGKLRIWDVISCTLKQEYTPDFNLTSPITDLEWILSSKKILDLSSKRKRKLCDDGDDTNEYLALGSKSGSIFIYSVYSCSIVNTFQKGHTSRVNSISWCKSLANQLFSCYEDQQLVQWNIETGSPLREWKCGKMSCVAVSPDGKSLVTAKTEIKWWDISGEKEKLFKTFNGHATDVLSLKFVQICGESCILSAAADNRFINVWLLNASSKDRCAFANFALDDALVSMSVWNTSDGGVDILASSRTGVLQSYHCTINGKKHTKPLNSKLNVQIASESDNAKAPVEQIPIVGASLCDENVAYIAYGNDAILSFEKLALNSSEKSMIIVRQDPKKRILSTKQQSANKILPSSSSKSVQYAHPEAVNGFSSNSTSKKPQKRPISSSKTVDVPLELRLENLVVDVPSTSTTPASESLVHLLLQGLKSKDNRILHDVLLDKEENVIRTTISRLPVDAVLPLSSELISMLQGKRAESDAAIKWLKFILIIHAAHLISLSQVTEIFAPVFPIIESRLNMLGPLYRLVGRLDLMVEQIKHRTDKVEKSSQNVNLQPKLIYQDEDSEEEDENGDAFKDEIVSNNDSDDHWPEDDDMSESDDDSGQEQNADIDMEIIDNT